MCPEVGPRTAERMVMVARLKCGLAGKGLHELGPGHVLAALIAEIALYPNRAKTSVSESRENPQP